MAAIRPPDQIQRNAGDASPQGRWMTSKIQSIKSQYGVVDISHVGHIGCIVKNKNLAVGYLHLDDGVAYLLDPVEGSTTQVTSGIVEVLCTSNDKPLAWSSLKSKKIDKIVVQIGSDQFWIGRNKSQQYIGLIKITDGEHRLRYYDCHEENIFEEKGGDVLGYINTWGKFTDVFSRGSLRRSVATVARRSVCLTLQCGRLEC